MSNLVATVEPAHFEPLDHYVRTRMQGGRAAGMAVAFFDHARTVHLATYGYADLEAKIPVEPSHLFEIGSITKSFTAFATLQAVDKGLLELQQPVTAYLPWFEVKSQYEPITLHHLLTHSAGLIGIIDRSPDIRGAVWALRETEAAWPPGSRFSYSDAGFQALTLILQELYQQSFADILRTHIFEPLEMFASAGAITTALYPRLAKGYRDLRDDRPHRLGDPLVPATWVENNSGDCCIASTADDMAKFGRMLLNGGMTPQGRILSAASFARMSQIQISADWCDYGYGLFITDHEGFRHLDHSGGMIGFSAELMVDAENQLGVVVLTNAPRQGGLFWKLMSYWRSLALGQPVSQVDLSVPDPYHVKNSMEYGGTYRGPRQTLTVVAHDQQLFLQHNDKLLQLEQRYSDEFYVDHPDFDRFPLRFERATGEEDVKGAITGLVFGPEWHVKDATSSPSDVEYPAEWNAYLGHYRSHNPWCSNFRVIVRKGRLLFVMPDGDEEELFPHSDAEFYVGEAGMPTRIKFDQIVNGQALRATYATCDYYRFFTP